MTPNAAMLMIVPLMIWSARTLIDSQAWSTEMASATPIAGDERDDQGRREPEAARSPACRAIGARATPTTQPTKARRSIVPSMPMFTTPERSHITPHRAPKAIGVADRRMIGEIGRTISIR